LISDLICFKIVPFCYPIIQECTQQ